MNRRTLAILGLLVAMLTAGCGGDRDRLRVVAAAGLRGVVADLVEDYRAEHPDRAVELVVGGSVELARRIAAGELEADVVFLSDGALFGELLQPEWTSFQIRWASDRMVLALADGAAFGDDWAAELLAPDTVVGRADPDRSAVGYRFEYVLRLHDRATPEGRIGEPLLAGSPGTPYEHAGALADALRAGEVDVAFLYASLAQEVGLRTIELPPRINLGAIHLAAVYAPVSVRSGDGVTPRPAAPVVHSVAVADGTRRRGDALDLLRLALGAGGRDLLGSHGLEPVVGAERVFSFGLPVDVEAILVATSGID